MKKIELPKGNFALVDDDDFEWLSQYRWFTAGTPNNIYAHRNIQERFGRRSLKMHREITKAPKGMFVDHINHNTLDNQKKNLRICTKAQNCQNRKRVQGTSKYKGVSFHKRTNKWCVQAFALFSTEEEAALAYNKVAKELHGEFAYLNDI